MTTQVTVTIETSPGHALVTTSIVYKEGEDQRPETKAAIAAAELSTYKEFSGESGYVVAQDAKQYCRRIFWVLQQLGYQLQLKEGKQVYSNYFHLGANYHNGQSFHATYLLEG